MLGKQFDLTETVHDGFSFFLSNDKEIMYKIHQVHIL